MSGIEGLKLKAKLSMDEMYNDQAVGKMEKNLVGHPDNQPASHTENQPSNKKTIHPSKQMKNKQVSLKDVKEVVQEIKLPAACVDEKPDNQTTNKSEEKSLAVEPQTFELKHSPNQQSRLYPTSVLSQKMPTYKMTFSLTYDIYKAFNDLYAQRMLQGRKTDKSDLVCEAIEWLIKMEEGNSN